MIPVLEIDNLSKQFPGHHGGTVALSGVSLSIGRGEVVGLLGLNGAGKSTLLRCALGLVRPTTGDAKLFGHPSASVRGRVKVGYLPEGFEPPATMSGLQVLRLLGGLNALHGNHLAQRIESVRISVDLADLAKKTGRYSKGMKVRLGLAQALLNEPEFLVLDEPTDGLDPNGIRMVRHLISESCARGISCLVSSHQLSEVELVADRVVILHHGVIVREGSLEELIRRGTKHLITVTSRPPESLGLHVESEGAPEQATPVA